MFFRLQVLVLALCLVLASQAIAAGTLDTVNVQSLQKMVQDNKGKPMVVNFFATWCPPCRAEIPGLVSLYNKYKDKLEIVGLTVDSGSTLHKVLPFCADMGINYPVYRAGSDLVQAFSVTSIPFNVGYDKNGRVAWAFSGILDEDGFEEMLRELLK